MKKKLIALVYTISIVMLLWLIMSWMDVISHNMTDYDYADWNIIANVFGGKL